jgi:hypothetical protein
MDVIASTGVFERHCGVQLALIIIFHSAQVGFGFVAF